MREFWNNGSNCAPVRKGDGSIVWVFCKEDLQEVMSPEAYEAVNKIIAAEVEEKIDKELIKQEAYNERNADGYLQLCQSTASELDELLNDLCESERWNKKKIVYRIQNIWKNLNNNL